MKLQANGNGYRMSARGVMARLLVGAVSWLVVAAILMINVQPRKYTLEVGELATEDILASRNVKDTITTQQRKQAAMDAVPDKYRQDDAVTADVLAKLEGCYDAMGKVRANGADEIRKLNANEYSAAYKDEAGNIQFTAAFVKQCHEALQGSFTDEDVRTIILSDSKVLDSLKEKVNELISQALKNGIKEEYLDDQKSSISQELISPLNRFDSSTQRLGMNLVATYLKANFIFDEDGTREAKVKAAQSVEDVVIKKDEPIVKRYDHVTAAQLQVLSDLGKLVEENNLHLLLYIGIGVFTALMLLIIWLYLLYFEEETFRSFRRLLMLFCIVALTVAAMWPARKLHYYFILNTAGTLLIAVLLSVRPAIVVNAVLALFTGIMAGSGETGPFSIAALPAAAAALAGGTLGLFVVRKTPHRSALMLAGILSGLMSSAIVVSADMITTFDWKTILGDLGYGLAGGLLSSMLCLGTLPIWESLFTVVTPMRLMELANPNHPLLKRLLMEAPGTYHHSIVVGNLAESAAEAIGANPLLTRTGAYYHDVGKLIRPYFFTENQLGNENPHDSISPELSKRILTAHTKDGVELAAKFGLPQQVQEIILEHHGTTPVMYFYHKAVKAAKEGETVSLDDYRYAGPKPHSREAAVIMLADSVEAGARALKDHSQEKLDEFTQQIVNAKLEDGQFDNCDLTMRDLSVITAEFRKVLGGIFHERVVYPQIAPQAKENGLS